MLKIKYLPQYFLALLMVILIFLEGWTYYLGKPEPTFKRYVNDPVPSSITDLSLRRYKAPHSPHLFSIKVAPENTQALIAKLTKKCNMQKITSAEIPAELTKVDDEMVAVIKKSPWIYLTKAYDTADPKHHRLCLLFRDKDTIYLFLYGDLE